LVTGHSLGDYGCNDLGSDLGQFCQNRGSCSAQGKLEPQDKVQDIQAPVAGVVKELYVQDGQSVKKGDVLLRLDPTADQS
jgi:acetyl/propionyl-CoA carboxylase alpha subunit